MQECVCSFSEALGCIITSYRVRAVFRLTEGLRTFSHVADDAYLKGMNRPVHQDMSAYPMESHTVWSALYERQREHLEGKASPLFLNSLDEMRHTLRKEGVPEVARMEAQLKETTGWTLKIVPGLIPEEAFFALLARQCFCTSVWVRRRDQFDYLEEPDMFHDTFGHIPPLMNQDFADFMQLFGEIGVEFTNSGNAEGLLGLARLYWYFIEFGFLRDAAGEPKLFGAGIMSSYGETQHAWSLREKLRPFDLEEVTATSYRTDTIQSTYFVLDSLDALKNDLRNWAGRAA